ncbi:MAG: tetratricopeptide repeat protein [bacterium]
MKRILLTGFLLMAVCGLALGETDNLLRRGWDQTWRGDHRGAVQSYRQFAASHAEHPQAPAALFHAASISLTKLNEPYAAQQTFLELTEKYPNTKWAAESFHRLAEIAEQAGDSEAALQYFSSGLRVSQGEDYRMPDIWISQMVQGCQTLTSALADPLKAIDVYQQITPYLPPGDVAAQMQYQLATALRGAGRTVEAAAVMASLFNDYPTSPSAAEAISLDREWVCQYIEVPWELLEQELQAQALARQLRFGEALPLLQGIIDTAPDSPLADNARFGVILCDVYLSADFATGWRRLREFIQQHPRKAQAVDAASHLENWENIVEMQEDLADNPDDYGTHLQLGFTMLRSRFFAPAEEHFLKALADTTSDDAYLGLGYVYGRTNRPAESVQYFERYLQNHPEEGNIFNQVGYAYLGMGNLEKALTCFERYRQLEPDNPNSHDSYAECLMNLGRSEEAIAEYQKAIETDPDFTNPYFMLGEIYTGLGNSAKALEYYHRYLELDPNGFNGQRARAQIDSLTQK